MAKKKSNKSEINLSPKYGINPTVLKCEICGASYKIAALGRLKGDKPAPKALYKGHCKDCDNTIKSGGIIFIEAIADENKNPIRTGRLIRLPKEFKEENGLNMSVVFLEKRLFEENFDKTAKKKKNSTKSK